MFGRNDIESVFKIKLETASLMEGAISKWLGMYCEKEGLRIPSAIASETARLTTLEMKIDISGSKRAEYLSDCFKSTKDNIRNVTELACALGGVILKPYISGSKIAVDVSRADRFIPVSFDDEGKMSAVIFVDKLVLGNKHYTRLEYHKLEGTDYTVSNRAFVSESDSDLGREISLKTVKQWSQLEPSVTLENIKEPLFAYFKMPMANNVDTDSPLGMSVFEKATSQIKDVNEQYKRLIWEFKSGERFVGIASTAIRHDKNGKPIIPKNDERLIKLFEWDEGAGEGLFKEWSPTLREQSYINGINTMLRLVEYNCSLAYGTLSDVDTVEKTAEEIKASKQRSYSHICDIQKQLQHAIEQLIYAMDVYATLYKLAPQGSYETAFEFDDSIVADRKSQFTELSELLSLNVIQPWEFRAWYLGESEEVAKERVGHIDMTEE